MPSEALHRYLASRGYEVRPTPPLPPAVDDARDPDFYAESEEPLLGWVLPRAGARDVIRAQAAARQLPARAALIASEFTDGARRWARRYGVELLDHTDVGLDPVPAADPEETRRDLAEAAAGAASLRALLAEPEPEPSAGAPEEPVEAPAEAPTASPIPDPEPELEEADAPASDAPEPVTTEEPPTAPDEPVPPRPYDGTVILPSSDGPAADHPVSGPEPVLAKAGPSEAPEPATAAPSPAPEPEPEPEPVPAPSPRAPPVNGDGPLGSVLAAAGADAEAEGLEPSDTRVLVDDDDVELMVRAEPRPEATTSPGPAAGEAASAAPPRQRPTFDLTSDDGTDAELLVTRRDDPPEPEQAREPARARQATFDLTSDDGTDAELLVTHREDRADADVSSQADHPPGTLGVGAGPRDSGAELLPSRRASDADDAALARHDPGLWHTSDRLGEVRNTLRDEGASPLARAREPAVSSPWLRDLADADR